jgi:hypothetical protein
MNERRTGARTIQGIQERFPWIMLPFAVMGSLLTPQRWACIVDRAAASITGALVFDTTRLAGFLIRCCGVVSRVRVRLLNKNVNLKRFDWRIRKWFWAVLWTSAVVFRLWPKKVPVPREEKKIRLISAPESYSDFQAPALLVPASLPCAEVSLLSSFLVQVAHLLQDVFPVIAPPQPEASSDRRERVKQAFSGIYRIVRKPPEWHGDLVRAEAEKNLLGALATGGPFAKLLERVDGTPGNDHYVIDLRHMNRYPVREGLCRLGCRIHYAAEPAGLKVLSIEYEGERIYPSDTKWDITERIALCSLVTHLTVWRHGMQYHVAGLAPIAPLTHSLPAHHPIRRLLGPHIAETAYTNFHTHLTLRRSGFDVTAFSFSYDTTLRYYDDGARNFNLSELDVRASLARRGIPESLNYSYWRQALRYYSLFERYVREYVDHYYSDEQALQRDPELQVWFDSIDSYLNNGIRTYLPDLTKSNLVKLCTLYIHAVTFEHEENTLWDYAVFLPTTVQQDGTGQSVGEVQSVVNFQFVISSATNRLMRDFTHLALDSGAADIMRRFQSELRQLQKEMEIEPDRYWQVFPLDLKASVSA